MNGYEMMAGSYRMLQQQGKIDQATADKAIRIYDFLAGCDTADLCQLVDSSAFNDLIRAFLELAVKSSGIDEEAQHAVRCQLRWIFDEMQAQQVLEKYLAS